MDVGKARSAMRVCKWMEGTRWRRPGTAVARRDVDEVRLKMHVGVVRQRVVLWVVLKRTRWAWLDTQVEHQGGRSTRIVRVNSEVGLRE